MTDKREELADAQTPTDKAGPPAPRLPWEVSEHGGASDAPVGVAPTSIPYKQEDGARMAQIAEGGRIAIMAKISDAKDRLVRLSQERDALTKQCQDLDEGFTEERATTSRLLDEARDLNVQINALEKEREDNLTTIGNLRAELNEVTKKNADMIRRCDSMAATIDEVTLALDAIDALE